jgi:beta-galactosidase
MGEVIRQGVLDVGIVKPMERKQFAIDIGAQEEGEIFLNFYAKTRERSALLAADLTIAREQIAICGQINKPVVSETGSYRVIADDKNRIMIQKDDLKVTFNKQTGLMEHLTYGTEPVLIGGFAPNFRRAITDNDAGNDFYNRCRIWFEVSEKREVKAIDADSSAGVIRVHYTFSGMDSDVVIQFNLKDDELPEIPRIGMHAGLDRGFTKLRYYGRGPYENYIDRKDSAFIGIFENLISESGFDYIRPQENGYRTDVRWLEFQSDALIMKVEAEKELSFAALQYAYEELERNRFAKQRHPNELRKSGNIELDFDYGQTGVGGDDSWGAQTHAKYKLFPDDYKYSFKIKIMDKSTFAKATVDYREL